MHSDFNMHCQCIFYEVGQRGLFSHPFLMRLSLFSDYSLRVLMYAALSEGPFRLDEVTDAYGVSRNHLAKVIPVLSQLGFLETRRGRRGGIELARAAGEIRLGQVIRQTEAQEGLAECFDAETSTCRIAGCCRLKGALVAALKAFYETLDEYTLEDLVKGRHRASMKRILLGAER